MTDYVVRGICAELGVDFEEYVNAKRKTGNLLDAQYHIVRVLSDAGISNTRIARDLGLSRNRVINILKEKSDITLTRSILESNSLSKEVIALQEQVTVLRADVQSLMYLEKGNAAAISLLMDKSK